MASIVANESEHRRGLVLGLTLAEVLLLLLFLILLALGARLIKEQRELKSATLKLDAATSFLDKLDKSGALKDTDAQKLVEELAKVKPLEESTKRLTEENARMKSELVKSAALQKLLSDANSIDPNESPAILKLAKDTLKAAGRSVDEQKLQMLSELGASLDKASEADRRTLMASIKSAFSSGGKTPGHKWPPIITLSDDGFSFRLGSAELTPEFENRIRQKIQEILENAKEYQVNIVEVVGHTDELAISGKTSNLDKELVPALRGATEIKKLIPGDNAGLGLARAVAVVDVLKRDGRLTNLRILPLSGAQLIETDESLATGAHAGDDPKRRRIEIRMRKPNPSSQ
jgi:flagellar motor protein MotB